MQLRDSICSQQNILLQVAHETWFGSITVIGKYFGTEFFSLPFGTECGKIILQHKMVHHETIKVLRQIIYNSLEYHKKIINTKKIILNQLHTNYIEQTLTKIYWTINFSENA
jgi:hypothetical protein